MIEYHIPFWREKIIENVNHHMQANPFEDAFEVHDALEAAFKVLPLYHKAKHIHFLNSATSGLEVMALALDLKAGDEIILPSFTHVSTANAFARTGAKLIFVDIDESTLNLSPEKVKGAISSKTKGIVPIHYGGCNRDFDALVEISKTYGIPLLEDASHCINSGHKGIGFGLHGKMGCISFHQTKNITSGGNGGCLFVEDEALNEACKVIIHHGTDRLAFRQGHVNKYQWTQSGGELAMPLYQMRFLLESLPYIEEVTQKRGKIWSNYREAFLPYELKGKLKCPQATMGNGHIFYLLFETEDERNEAMAVLKAREIQALTHYEPLHKSLMGQALKVSQNELENTVSVSKRLLRLPIHDRLTPSQQNKVIEVLKSYLACK